MRTHGILLVRDAIVLLGILPTDGECCVHTLGSLQQKPNTTGIGAKHRFWRRSCNQVLGSLEEFSQKLLDNMKRFREHGDRSGADIIGSSCITCLAHLTVLYDVVCRTDPQVTVETYNLCDSALQRLGMLTSKLQFDGYTYFDLLLGVRPFFHYFPVVTAQTGDWDRTLGRSRYRSSTPA